MNKELQVAIERLRGMQDDTVWFIPTLLTDCKIPTFEIREGVDIDSKQWVALYDDWDEGVRRIINIIKSE